MKTFKEFLENLLESNIIDPGYGYSSIRTPDQIGTYSGRSGQNLPRGMNIVPRNRVLSSPAFQITSFLYQGQTVHKLTGENIELMIDIFNDAAPSESIVGFFISTFPKHNTEKLNQKAIEITKKLILFFRKKIDDWISYYSIYSFAETHPLNVLTVYVELSSNTQGLFKYMKKWLEKVNKVIPEFILVKQDQEGDKIICYFMRKRDYTPDWRPTETVPEDYYG